MIAMVQNEIKIINGALRVFNSYAFFLGSTMPPWFRIGQHNKMHTRNHTPANFFEWAMCLTRLALILRYRHIEKPTNNRKLQVGGSYHSIRCISDVLKLGLKFSRYR